MSTVEKLLGKWKKEFEAEKSNEEKELFNELAEVIMKKKAYRPHVVECLLLLLFETLSQKYSEIQADRALHSKEPTPIKS